MKSQSLLKWSSLVCLLVNFGCVHNIPLSYTEYCGSQGLAFQSVNDSRGTAMAYNYQTGGVATANTFNSSITCVRPQTPVDRCEISNSEKTVFIKQEYNDGHFARNAVVWTGYVLWILPGVGAYYYYDSKRDNVLQTLSAQQRSLSSCDASVPAVEN